MILRVLARTLNHNAHKRGCKQNRGTLIVLKDCYGPTSMFKHDTRRQNFSEFVIIKY